MLPPEAFRADTDPLLLPHVCSADPARACVGPWHLWSWYRESTALLLHRLGPQYGEQFRLGEQTQRHVGLDHRPTVLVPVYSQFLVRDYSDLWRAVQAHAATLKETT